MVIIYTSRSSLPITKVGIAMVGMNYVVEEATNRIFVVMVDLEAMLSLDAIPYFKIYKTV